MGNGQGSMDQGLSSGEAAARLRKLGPPQQNSSRSLASIVAANVFTLFNAIIAAFFAPHARVVRDGEVLELIADEVVPGDLVEIGPGDQLIADGEVVASRGMTMDESLLTGESDGIKKGDGDRVLSGSFCVSGSGSYVVDAVREESYAGKIAGEAKAFRHPPSPLQEEVNRVIIAS